MCALISLSFANACRKRGEQKTLYFPPLHCISFKLIILHAHTHTHTHTYIHTHTHTHTHTHSLFALSSYTAMDRNGQRYVSCASEGSSLVFILSLSLFLSCALCLCHFSPLPASLLLVSYCSRHFALCCSSLPSQPSSPRVFFPCLLHPLSSSPHTHSRTPPLFLLSKGHTALRVLRPARRDAGHAAGRILHARQRPRVACESHCRLFARAAPTGIAFT